MDSHIYQLKDFLAYLVPLVDLLLVKTRFEKGQTVHYVKQDIFNFNAQFVETLEGKSVVHKVIAKWKKGENTLVIRYINKLYA